jgi:ribose 5-phosphate isomerase A
MPDPFQQSKRSAARAAADLVQPEMVIGLGTGSTFVHALERLAERMRHERLSFRGVPTSASTANRARELGIDLCTLEDVDRLDLAIDGADEVDHNKDMIKGGGGALLREKIVAAAAREMIVLVSSNKLVDVLGAFHLPVEVLEFGWKQATAALTRLGGKVRRRMTGNGSPFRSDSGNLILDCDFGLIRRPAELAPEIESIPGVVDHGLFLGMAGRVFVGYEDGTVRMIP